MADDEDDLFDHEDDEDDGLISFGKIADHKSIIENNFSEDLKTKFEIYSYRNAANILAKSFPDQFADITTAMTKMAVTKTMIRMPGGSKGPVAKHVDTLFSDKWIETRISADLHVKLLHAKRTKIQPVLKEYTREGFLDGHRIDFVNGRVALDLEWNSKDQTYDRDLYAMSAFYEAGAIDVGVIITRGFSLDSAFFRSLGKVLKKDGTEGTAEVHKKYGASTTWMGKLLYRLDAGRNGGCPVLAIGITPHGIV